MGDREEFEKWWKQEFGFREDCEWVDATADADDDEIERIWSAWQAARAQGGQGENVVGCTEQDHDPSLRAAVNSLIESARCLGSAQAQPPDPQVIDYWAKQVDHYRAKLYTQPQPAQQGSVPEGWKLVPIESTSEMDLAAECADMDKPVDRDHAEAIWSTMIAAAPQPPKEGKGDE